MSEMRRIRDFSGKRRRVNGEESRGDWSSRGNGDDCSRRRSGTKEGKAWLELRESVVDLLLWLLSVMVTSSRGFDDGRRLLGRVDRGRLGGDGTGADLMGLLREYWSLSSESGIEGIPSWRGLRAIEEEGSRRNVLIGIRHSRAGERVLVALSLVKPIIILLHFLQQIVELVRSIVRFRLGSIEERRRSGMEGSSGRRRRGKVLANPSNSLLHLGGEGIGGRLVSVMPSRGRWTRSDDSSSS